MYNIKFAMHYAPYTKAEQLLDMQKKMYMCMYSIYINVPNVFSPVAITASLLLQKGNK